MRSIVMRCAVAGRALLLLGVGALAVATPSSAQVSASNYLFATLWPSFPIATDNPLAGGGLRPLFRITTLNGDPFETGDEGQTLADIWLNINGASVFDPTGAADIFVDDLNFPNAEVTRDMFRFEFSLVNPFGSFFNVAPEIIIRNPFSPDLAYPDNLPAPPFSGPIYIGRDRPTKLFSLFPNPPTPSSGQINAQVYLSGLSDQDPRKVVVPARVEISPPTLPGFWRIIFPTVSIAAGQKRTFIVYIGLGWATGEYEKPYSATATSVRALGIANSAYSQTGFNFPFHFTPEPFTARLGIFNQGPLRLGNTTSGAGGSATIFLPEGLRLAQGEAQTKAFSLIDIQQERFLGWDVIADNLRTGVLEYQITVSPVGPQGIAPKVIKRKVVVPILPWSFFPAALTPSDPTGIDFVGFPFDFNDRYPPIALGLARDHGSLTQGEDELTGRFATYLPDRKRYAIFDPINLEPELAQTVPGRAYWLSLQQSADMYTLLNGLQARALLMEGFHSVDPRREFEFFLDSRGDGWNGISPPYHFPIFRGTLLVVKDNEVFTFREAVDRGFVRRNIYFWDRRIGAYRFSDFDGQILEPYRGYWVRALRDVFLIFQPIPIDPTFDPLSVPFRLDLPSLRMPTIGRGSARAGQSGLQPQLDAARARALAELQRSGVLGYTSGAGGTATTMGTTPAAPEWRIRLVATCGRLQDPDNFLGILNAATDRFDTRDAEKAPAIASSVSLRFLSSDYRGGLAADYRHSGPSQTWTVEVAAPRSGGAVTVDWRGLVGVPDSVRLQLIDRTTGTVIDLRSRPSYTITLGDRQTRQFVIISTSYGAKSAAPGTRTPVAPR